MAATLLLQLGKRQLPWCQVRKPMTPKDNRLVKIFYLLTDFLAQPVLANQFKVLPFKRQGDVGYVITQFEKVAEVDR